jgi:alcohol dehydrogenase
VGLSAVMIAAARGARVVAVDVSPAALELAVSVGAVETIDASQVEVVPAVRRVTEGGARVSIDALGSVTTCQNSIRGLRKRGRHIQIGLLVAADALPPVPMAEVVAGELEVIGSHGMSADAYPAMLAEVMSRSLEPQRLVTRRLSLDDVPEALVGMGQRPGSGIAMVRP